MIVFGRPTAAQRSAALGVWHAARTKDGRPPSPARIERVREKLADNAAYLFTGREADQVIAMALAEPFREQHGDGPLRPDAGHVSMVFVAPEHWGRGIGGQLLDALHREMQLRGWTISCARRLYEGRGYRSTGDAKHLQGEEILRYEIQLTADHA